MTNDSTKLKVYLAGKIAKNDWRHDIVENLRGAYDHERDASWPVLEGAVLGHDYTGPHFISDDHGCFHGPASHGNGVMGSEGSSCRHGREPLDFHIVHNCQEAIRASDVVFAWFDEGEECTAYGTLAELGFAVGLHKWVVFGSRAKASELWFPWAMASERYTAETPLECLNDALSSYVDRRLEWAHRIDLIKACESPIESKLAEVLVCSYAILDSRRIQAQHRVTCDGHSYRLDFAIPDSMIAIECDGHDYHERTKEQARNDRSRDRALQLAGWTVLRFTGSEIHADAHACVEQIEAALRMQMPEALQ